MAEQYLSDAASFCDVRTAWRARMNVIEPSDFAAEINDRMPVFLTEQQFASWLSWDLQRWSVSKRVIGSKADADDPTLIEPIQLVPAETLILASLGVSRACRVAKQAMGAVSPR